MKKLFLIFLILLALPGCAEGVNSPSSESYVTEEFPVTDLTPPADTPAPYEPNSDLAPLALLGDYYVTSKKQVLFNYPFGIDTREYDPDTFKKYFYGTWTGKGKGVSGDLIIDDTENRNALIELLASGYIIWVSEHVIAVSFTNGGMGDVWWLDINEPDSLYRINEITGGSHIAEYFGLDEDLPEELSASILYQGGDYYDVYMKK